MDLNKTPDQKKYQNSGNVAVLSLIPDSAKNILDVGCGSGDNARILLNKGCSIDCVTISEEEKKIAQIFCNNIFIKNLEEGLPSEILYKKYDVVICSHVIEHIAYPDKLLNDIKKTLIDNKSLLIVALPNFLSYKNRLRIFFGNFDYEKSGIMDYTHLRWYTHKSGKKLLTDNGYRVTKIIVDGNIPFARLFKSLDNKIKIGIMKFLFSLSPGLFGGQFIYTCIIENEHI